MKNHIARHKEIILIILTLTILTIICAITGFGTKIDHLLPAKEIIKTTTGIQP